MVGDPSGRDESRKHAHRRSEIAANKAGIKKRVRSRSSASATAVTDAVMADNAEWLTQAPVYRLPA
jgi:tyrosyl-tRNA synthetase